MITGNFEDKYNSKNPISKILVANFITSLKQLLDVAGNPKKIVEIGVGEGHLLKIIADKFPNSKLYASDISKKILRITNKNLPVKKVFLGVEDAQNLSYPSNAFDLSVCCEVLEHVQNPEKALSEIRRVGRGKVILSVPVEPLWRLLNMLRGKYLKAFGNTPGHLHHWTPQQFVKLVEDSGLKVLSRKFPLPWQMMLVQRKNNL